MDGIDFFRNQYHYVYMPTHSAGDLTMHLPASLESLSRSTLNTLYARMITSLDDMDPPGDCDIVAMFWSAATDNGMTGYDIGMAWGECWPCIKRECKSMGWPIGYDGPEKRPIAMPRGA